MHITKRQEDKKLSHSKVKFLKTVEYDNPFYLNMEEDSPYMFERMDLWNGGSGDWAPMKNNDLFNSNLNSLDGCSYNSEQLPNNCYAYHENEFETQFGVEGKRPIFDYLQKTIDPEAHHEFLHPILRALKIGAKDKFLAFKPHDVTLTNYSSFKNFHKNGVTYTMEKTNETTDTFTKLKRHRQKKFSQLR